MIAALLGVDALCRMGGGEDDDGLVVVNMSTAHRPERFADYAAARLRFAELQRRSDGLPEPDRALYYRQLCGSTLALLRWRESGLPFEEQIGAFLHVPAAPAADRELDDLRTTMRGLLTQMGYDGDLAAQCAAWEERQRVPPDEIPDALAALLDEAWDRTAARLPLPAPKSDGMRVVPVSGVHFNARCDYLRRT